MIEGSMKLTNGESVRFQTETWAELFKWLEGFNITSIEAKEVDLQHFRQGRCN